MEWHKKFGSRELNLNPLETDYSLVGREREAKEILYRIESGNMLLIEGLPGSGKTALLKYAIDNFEGEGKVVYVDAAKLSRRLDITRMLRKRGMILLMDNVHYLSKKNNLRIKHYFDQDLIKSVVFTTTGYGSVSFTNSIKDRIGRSIIKLKALPLAKALKVAKERLDSRSLPDNVLKQLYRESNRNIKEFLRSCNMLYNYAVQQGKSRVSADDIKKMPKANEKSPDDKTQICEECDERLIRIGEYWRCRNCDEYCKSCGALVEEGECPECGTKAK